MFFSAQALIIKIMVQGCLKKTAERYPHLDILSAVPTVK
jgi:hypothetical protein